MLPAILWTVLGHHGEAADPTLMLWVKHRLDQLLDLGPWTVVGLLGLLLLAMPVALVAFYLTQRRHMPSAPVNPTVDSACRPET